jgi:hypothetical protein
MESTSSMLMAVGFSLGIPLFARRLCIAISHHPRTWLIAAVWIRVSDLELFCLSFLLLKLSLSELFSASFQRVAKERSAHRVTIPTDSHVVRPPKLSVNNTLK